MNMKLFYRDNHHIIFNGNNRKATIKFPWCTYAMPAVHFPSCRAEIMHVQSTLVDRKVRKISATPTVATLVAKWPDPTDPTNALWAINTINNINFIRHPDYVCYTLLSSLLLYRLSITARARDVHTTRRRVWRTLTKSRPWDRTLLICTARSTILIFRVFFFLLSSFPRNSYTPATTVYRNTSSALLC
jgi:hypothetical protein